MSFLENDVAVSLTSIFMKFVGIWMAGNQHQQRMRNIMVTYNVIAIFFALWIQAMDMYHSWGNIRVSGELLAGYKIILISIISTHSQACLFSTSNTLSLILPLLKIFILLCHKEDFFRLILYMKKNFLELRNYDDYERKIVIGCNQKCTFFICFFTFLTIATTASYMVIPLIGESNNST